MDRTKNKISAGRGRKLYSTNSERSAKLLNNLIINELLTHPLRFARFTYGFRKNIRIVKSVVHFKPI